ncbi:MAG TPA: MoxR family ATPase [Bacteroidales bacterium]|nr:MoxR family ATPase [Bacteroidales bacterium]
MNNQEFVIDPSEFLTLQDTATKLKQEIARVIVGQDEMVELMLVAILSNGHVLLEGVPGIAKTLTAKVMSRLISSGFSRIQFTPDLMPSDITGTSVFNNKSASFDFNPGPIFSNIILIDEINRAPAKTQSALFEVMEERQVTVDGKSYPMQSPFLVFATQNPLEHEGTYRLPEAQLDRFIFKINVKYPTLEEEFQIILNAHERKEHSETEKIAPVLSAAQIIDYQRKVKYVHVEEPLMRYIAQIIINTRNHPSLYLGASPRASINTLAAAKAMAAINGRSFVIPEDIKSVLYPILNHRIYLTPEKELEGENENQIITDVIASVEIPR